MLDLEAGRSGRFAKDGKRLRGRDFFDAAAILADREDGRIVAMLLVGAGDIGVERLDPVGEALIDQAVEGAVDRRRRGDALVPDRVENLIGGHRAAGSAQRPIDRAACR